MGVYVDDFRWPFKHGGRLMFMCHMLADTESELHAMADRIGVKREWFHRNHYNICQSKRREAVRFGARQITKREAVRLRTATNQPKAAEG